MKHANIFINSSYGKNNLNILPLIIGCLSFLFLSIQTTSAQSPGGVGSNMNLWLKADSGVTDSGNTVTAWTDQTGTNVFSLSGDPSTNTTSLNLNNTIAFDGAGDYLTGATAIDFKNGYAVFKMLNIGTLISSTGGNANQGYFAKTKTLITGNNQGTYVQTDGDMGTEFHLTNMDIIAGQPAENTLAFLDGASLTTSLFLGPNTMSIHNSIPHVGRSQDDATPDYLEGEIAEVIMYSSSHTAIERNQIQSYLALKYGISLDQTSPTDYLASDGSDIWDASDNTGYTNDIFGIGRDDGSALDQRISQSVNDDTVLTIALDADFTAANNDASRTTAHTNDKQFLMLANNGAATNAQSAELDAGLGFTQRLTREWKVDATNFSQNVSLKFEGYDETWSIITTADGDFSSGVTIMGALNTNGEFTTSTPLADGDHITLAKYATAPGGLVTNLELWLKADSGLDLTGSAVNTWEDQSEQGYDGTAISSPLLVDGSNNFNPSVNFDRSSSQYIDLPDGFTDFTSGISLYVVAKPTGTVGNFERFIDFGIDAGDNNIIMARNGSTTDFVFDIYDDGSIGRSVVNGIIQQESNTIYGALLPGGNPGDQPGASIFQNGGSFTVNTPNEAFVPRTVTRINNYIGKSNWADTYYNGEISEVIIFSNEISSTERQQLESYLAIKYGLNLDQTTPQNYLASDGTIIWNASDNAGYTNDIFGIGRDDASGLDQRVSKSVNDDAILTMALDADFTAANNDASRTTIHANDKQFLMIANNGATTDIQSAELDAATGFNTRLAREWKTDATSFTQNVSIKFEGFDEAWSVIATTDGDFSSGVTTLGALNTNGEFTTTTGIADALVFTLAKLTTGPGGVVDDLVLWLDAGKKVQGTSAITDWGDSSENGLDATQATANMQPSISPVLQNFNPSVRFDGTDNLESNFLSDIINSDLTFVSVDNRTSDPNNFNIILGQKNGVTSAGEYLHYGYRPDTDFITLAFYAGDLNLTTASYRSPFSTKNAAISLATHNGVSGKTLWQNTESTSYFDSNTNTINLTNDQMGLIGAQGLTEFYYGDLSEIIVFKDDLTTNEQNRIKSYTALKYGITLDQSTDTDYLASDSSVIWDASDNTGYTNDIFGIGRDDASGLNQRVSKSVNDDTVLTIALDADFTTANNDASRTTAYTNDKQFLMIANNGTTTNTQSAELDATTGFNERMTREWKVDATNFSQNVSLKFEGYDETWSIIATADGDFSSGVTTIGALNANGEFTTSSTIADGLVFTLARVKAYPGGVEDDLIVWLRLEEGLANTTDNTRVDTWTDSDGNIFSKGTSNGPFYRTTDLLNYHPRLQFNGNNSDTELKSTNTFDLSVGSNEITAFGVGRNTSSGILTEPFIDIAGSSTSHNPSIGFDENRPTMWDINSSEAFIWSGSGYQPGQPTILGGRYQSSSSGAELFLNGKIQTSTQTMFSNVNSYISIGSPQNDSSRIMSGDMTEALVYNREITETERQRVESYLAVKYGITIDQTTATDYLASDSSVIWDASNNAGYTNDIFGIGRNDLSGLNQKASQSINDSAVLTIALDADFTVANKDAARTTIHTNDKQFLMVANNGAATDTQTTELDAATGFDLRLAREWKVDATNFSQNVHLKFDGYNEFWSIISTPDGDFSSGVTTIGELNANGEFTTSSPLVDGVTLTLAKVEIGPGGIMSNLTFWIKTDQGTSTTTNGAVISSWADQTDFGYTMNEAVAGQGPQYLSNGVNFNPAADFVTANNGHMESAQDIDPDALNPKQIYIVYDLDGNPAHSLMGNDDNDFDTIIGVDAINGDGVNETAHTTAASTNQPHILVADLNHGTANGSFARVDGQQFTNFTYDNANGGSAVNALGKGYFGSGWTFQGNIAEAIIFGGGAVPSGTTRQQVETYLAIKYAITLDQTSDTDYLASDGSVIWDASDNVGYTTDIFGIGRDNASGLNQKVSRSINNSTGPILATTNHFTQANNDTSRNKILDNGSFVIMGHNNGTDNSFTSTFDSESNKRSDRVWKVDETGTAGAVYFAIPKSSITFPSGSPILVISDDTTFDSSDTLSTLLDDGTYYYAQINPADGDYLAMATGSPQYTVSQTALTIDENESTGTFTVVLDLQPTSDVVFDISSDATDEATVSAAQLTFTSDNWNTPQTITVTSVDDNLDRDDTATVTVAVNDSGSDDNFDALADQSVAITITDDDTIGFSLSETTLTLAENAGTGTFTVVLDAVPSSNVVFDIASSATGEATVSPAQLTFTIANWNTPQTITVTAVNDTFAGNDTATVTAAVNDANSDNSFDALANQSVAITLTSDETAGFTIGGALSIDEDGGTEDITVVLNAQPRSNVLIDISNDTTAEATTSATQLTFTDTNWSTPQSVTVTAVNDLIDRDDMATFTLSINDTGSDDAYDPVQDQVLDVNITDDDTFGITVSETELTIDENGGTETFTVVVNTQPEVNVVLDVTSGDTSEATVSLGQLTFTAANYTTPQTITVTGVDDSIVRADDTTEITISLNLVDSADSNISASDHHVDITLTDDDTSTFTVSETSLTLAENAGTDTFTVVLDAQPDTNVVFDISSAATTEATVSATQLTFTDSNWDTPQTITVTGVDDSNTTSDSTTITIAVNDAGSDDNFDALADQTVAITLTDDEIGTGPNGTSISAFDGTGTANGSDTELITLQLRNNAGDDLAMAGIDITFAVNGNAVLSSTTATTDANGQATVTVTNTFEEPINITATVDNDNDGGTSPEIAISNGSPLGVIFSTSGSQSFLINAIANANVNENAAYTGATPIISGSANGSLTYALGGNDAADFTIDTATGVVSMVARDFESPADADTDNVYELTITATDADSNSDSEDWTVTVDDVTETTTIAIDVIADATVNENAAYTGATPSITGTPIGSLTYALDGNDAADFTIDTATGVVSMVARDFESPDDDDTNNVYELTITATDADSNSDSEDWTVTVNDVTETTTIIIDAIADATVDENAAYTGATPSITGTPIGSLTYALGGNDAADFTIDTATGVVSMVARDFESPADADTDNVYELTITATDADSNSDSEDWTVTVDDVTETTTIAIDVIADATVNENAAYTGATPSITGTPIGSLTYALDGNDAADFTIDTATGVVSMVARDFESPEDADTNNVYELTITATDADSNSDSEDWTVTVNDVTETTTIIIDAIADATVNENAAYTGATPSITGTPIGSLTYALGGNDAADFTIDAATGVVSMVARDFESPDDDDTDNIYELTITATDADSNSDSEDWTVTVDDVTETTTIAIDVIADATVNENAAYTGATPSITGTPIGNLTYTLGGNDAADFTIDTATGVVSMVARDFESPADADTNNVYELTITATDADSNSDSEDWTVTVNDVTETTTIIIDVIADATVNENAAYTGATPSITGTPIGNLTYTLGGNDAADFTIDAATGVVSMVARDFESPDDDDTDNIYELTITATDADSNSDSEDWTVTVDDVTETTTIAIDVIADATVNENAAYTGATPSITGTPIGNLTYTLGGNDAADFTIDTATGVVSMVARDFESPADADTNNVYELTITATDADSNSDSEDWTVTVNDVTETTTIIIDVIADATVNENAAYTGATPSITGTPIGNLTYTLGGNDAADFTIDTATGVVSMVARDFESPADADTNNVYELTITATDADSNSDSEDWTVTVNDVTETTTIIIDAIADATVNENAAYTGATPSITGTPIGSLTYALGGNDAADFTIDAATGVVSMVARDFESPDDDDTDNIYELTITATDADSNSDSEDWTVTVDDVTETTTIAIDVIADATVNENAAYTGATPSITGTPIGNLTYTLGGNDAADFTIDTATGVVSMVARDFESPADADTNNVYELTITATDADSNSDSEDWTVTVDDVTETTTIAIDAIADATVNENAAYTGATPSITGTPIGSLTYTLDGNDAADFTIDTATGVVSMVARDFESPEDADTNNVYELTITATDADSNSDSEDWTVTVDDVTETTTIIIDAIADATVNENAAYTGATPSITGTPIGSLTYALGGNDAADFTIDTATGVVSMVARDFESPEDADTNNVYELTITATDADSNSDSEDWTVTVNDVTETTTIIIDAIADATVDENAAYTGATPSITGTPIGSLTYALGGNDAADFTINTATGVVSMVARDFESPEDADTNNVYELTITATDADSNSDSEDWTVTVNDVTETTTIIIDAIADATVNENAAYTGATPSITGTPIGSLTYALGGNDAADFTIDTATGVVSMVARDFESPADADTNNVYELTITATDADSNSDSEDWTVTVNNVTETTTIAIDAIADATVDENAAYTGATPSITGTPIGSLTYALGGNDAADFTIDAATGVVSMVARDFESPADADTNNVYELTITATDADSNSDSEDWTVTVDDVTETTTIAIDAIADATVDENAAYTGATPSITGTPIGSLTYTLGGNDAADFTIDTATGVVSMVARDFESPADADTNNVYELTITATDADSNSDSEDWTVTVNNVTETTTIAIDAIADATVDENAAYTGATPSITGTPIGSLTYTLGGNDAADFTIDTATGVVSMVARDFESPADADTNNVYELTITATDADSNSDSEDWTVTVNNVTETTTIAIDAIADATVDENAAYTGATPSITGTPIGSLTYTLGGNDAADFTIDAATGVVSMVARDFESPADADTNNVYELTITATDADSNSDSEDWTVTVDDVTETTTIAIDAIADATVNENAAYTGATPSITGTPIGSLTYALGGNDAADFTIDTATGVVSMVARDFESPADADTNNVYELTITATDADSNSDSEDWTVTVNNVTETTTIAIDAIADATVDENAAYTGATPSITGTPIGSLTYTLGGNDAADFTIDAATGVVSMVARDFESPADADTNNVYELTITATDADSNSDSEDWTVTVDDVTETTTIAIDAIADATVDENAAYTGATPSITGTPIGSLTYTLGGNDAADFTIDTATGVVSMVARDFESPADADTNNVYELTITATDADSNSDSEDWTVTVNNVTETTTIAIDAIADATVDENAAYTGATPSITGTPIGSLTYTLGGNDAADFTIDAATGVVSMVARDFESPADADTNNVYELTITATDTNSNIDSVSWTVSILNVVEDTTDSDGDGLPDEVDPNPNNPDTDGDGIPDGADSDVDGDGTPDNGTDTDGDGINDEFDSDIDGDGIPDNGTDSDGDGINDENDTVDDSVDSDGDGLPDAIDPNPNNPDTDGDGIPDGADSDVDGDGTPDNGTDTDGDGINDEFDSDVDGDGIPDNGTDSDGDGINDENDTVDDTVDTDGDGLPDAIDPNPNNPDTDGDGIPDGADSDVDGDGTPDNGTDTDGDGINDEFDSDVDGDGIPDNGTDSDGDGINDENDTVDDTVDTDGDGVPDVNDAFPNDPNESEDADGDGIGANADADDTDATTGAIRKIITADAFTPNGDGINDTWVIQGIENYSNAVVTVYNRNGREVFKATNYKNDWNGRFKSNSEALPAGSYYFLIELNNGKAPMDGWIFINY